jgi:hypothetical protein
MTDEKLFRLQVILSNSSSYDYAIMARDFHAAAEDVLCKLENSPNTTYFPVKQINLYETINGARKIIRQLSLD